MITQNTSTNGICNLHLCFPVDESMFTLFNGKNFNVICVAHNLDFSLMVWSFCAWNKWAYEGSFEAQHQKVTVPSFDPSSTLARPAEGSSTSRAVSLDPSFQSNRLQGFECSFCFLDSVSTCFSFLFFHTYEPYKYIL